MTPPLEQPPSAAPDEPIGLVFAGKAADVALGGLALLDRAALNLIVGGVGRVLLVGATEIQLERIRRHRDAADARVERVEHAADLTTLGGHPLLVAQDDAVLSRGSVLALRRDLTEADGAQPAWVSEAGSEGAALVYLPRSRSTAVDAVQSLEDPITELARLVGGEPRRLEEQVALRYRGRRSIRGIENRLLRALIKPTDGPVSKILNRPLSLAVSRYLARWGVSPNAVTTFVFLFTLVGAGFALSTSYLSLLVAGIIFQIASVLDGCDGEVSRLSFRSTRWGAWYDTISDNVRYFAFYGALGVSLYRSTEAELYVWATVAFLLLATFACVTMARFVLATQDHLTNLAVVDKVSRMEETEQPLWQRLTLKLRVIIKQDVNALLCFLCLALGQIALFFWAAFLGLFLMTISVVRALADQPERDASGQAIASTREHREAKVFLLALAGIGVLGYLLSQLPLEAAMAEMYKTGSHLWVAFAVAPLWFLANAIGMKILARTETSEPVPVTTLWFNQLVSTAYSAFLPVAGLGGEAFKVRHLSERIGRSQAEAVVERDRLVHTASVPLFAGIALIAASLTVPWSVALATVAGAGGAVLLAAGIAIAIMASRPAAVERLAAWVHLGLRIRPVPVGELAPALSLKLLGRALSLVELWVIFEVLGYSASPAEVIAVGALLAASSALFFIVPQGIGVNEAAIVGAFFVLGLPLHLGLAFGLIRRVRVLFWSAVGVALRVPQVALGRWRGLAPSPTD